MRDRAHCAPAARPGLEPCHITVLWLLRATPSACGPHVSLVRSPDEPSPSLPSMLTCTGVVWPRDGNSGGAHADNRRLGLCHGVFRHHSYRGHDLRRSVNIPSGVLGLPGVWRRSRDGLRGGKGAGGGLVGGLKRGSVCGNVGATDEHFVACTCQVLATCLCSACTNW